MEDAPGSDHLPARREAAAWAVAVPEMPKPAPEALWRTPYVIPAGEYGRDYAVGWQGGKKDGPCFLVARIGAMGTKVLERFPLTEDGWARAWAALVDLDADAARETAKTLQKWYANADTRKAEGERQSQAYEVFARAGRMTVFKLLGVQVPVGGDGVYTLGVHNAATKTNTSQLLGPLAGSQAMVTDGSQAWSPGRAMFMPIGLTGLATKTKADAAVVFPDGTVHTAPLNDNYAVREAQKQVVQFNALAGATTPAATETGGEPADRLRKLQELRDADLITQEEYETKRAEIIRSI